MRAPRSLVILLIVASLQAVTAQETTIPVPLRVNGRPTGEITVRITSNADFTESVAIVPAELAGILGPQLGPDTANAALLETTTWTDLDAFEEIGLAIEFDREGVLVRVRIPPELLRPVEVAISGVAATSGAGATRGRGVEVAQANVSAILNLEGWTRFTYEQTRLDYRVMPELALNLYRAVIELQGGVRSTDPIGFLDHARLTWDVPELRSRLQVGDLRFLETEMVGVTRITGISFATEESLGVGMIGGGGVALPIVLPETGTVLVARNASQVTRRTLDPGNYLLTGFPLVQGINEITVSWPGPEGATTVDLLVPHDTELLETGRIEAGLAVGAANRDLLDPMATLSVAYGAMQPLTLGVRFGSAFLRPEFDVGVSGVLATSVGSWRISSDVGIGPNGRLTIDVPLAYRLVDSRPEQYRSLGASLGVSYAVVPAAMPSVDAPPVETLRAYASAFVNLALPDGFSVTPRLSYSYASTPGGGPTQSPHDLRFVAGLRRAIRGGASLSANVGLTYRDELNFLASVTYSASFPDVRQNLFVQQDLTAGKASAYWSRYADNTAAGFSWSASAQVPVDRTQVFSLGAQTGYQNLSVRATASHGLSGILETGEYQNATSLSIRSALLFADGVFAISTPAADSFVIVTGDPNSAVPMGLVRPVGRSDEPLNGATLAFAGVRSYTPFQVVAEPLELVLGAEEREPEYYAIPSYRSGTVIRVGVERNIYVGGVLLDAGERPLGFTLGVWQRVDSAPGEGEFFTDDDGYFEIYNLAAGSYRLHASALPGALYEFVIAPDAPEYVDVGNLNPVNGGAAASPGGAE